jgi:ubiquinone/menaquinone biosynthesis C-methylase UbiE
MTGSGTLDRSYHIGRKTKKSLIYRLNRRTQEVVCSIRKHFSGKPSIILDMGTADALMLSMIKKTFPSAYCIGIELSRELIEANTDKEIGLLQGNVNSLPIPDSSLDIVIATAIIEHVPDPPQMLFEARRVLTSNGLIILTSPAPFWERVASIVGHLKDDQHNNVMNLRELKKLFKEAGFKILESRKFMLSPVGMPLEIPIENAMRRIGLYFLFANQLIVGKKNE